MFDTISVMVSSALAGAVGNIIFSYLIERRFHQNKIVVTLLTVFVAGIASIFSLVFLANPEGHQPLSIVVIFITSLLLWAVAFHVGSVNFGYLISGIDLGAWSALSEN